MAVANHMVQPEIAAYRKRYGVSRTWLALQARVRTEVVSLLESGGHVSTYAEERILAFMAIPRPVPRKQPPKPPCLDGVPHHWVLSEQPDDGVYSGQCKKCGASYWWPANPTEKGFDQYDVSDAEEKYLADLLHAAKEMVG